MIEVDAPAARVWRALTDPALVCIWSGQEAQIDAREGGLYRIGTRTTGTREAHIDIFEPNRRLRLIYFNSPDLPSSDSAVVDDFLLDVRKGEGTTSLRLLGSGVPEEPSWDHTYVRLRMGWERFMARIKVTLESPPRRKPPSRAEPKDPPLPGLDY
ncbi:MAG: SRPBCC family protein [Steroidobacteraceae bacterium]